MATNLSANEIQNLLTQNRKDLGQRIADIPRTEENLRAGLFGGDETIKSLRTNYEQKVQELYEHDKRLADVYANPSSELYMQDPYAREKVRAMQKQGTMGEIAGIQNMISTRQDVLGDALEKAMKLVQYGIEAKKLEADMLQNEFANQLKLEGGGEDNAMLSLSELQAVNAMGYNFPYGTRRSDLIKQGVVMKPKLSAAEDTQVGKLQRVNAQVDDLMQKFARAQNKVGGVQSRLYQIQRTMGAFTGQPGDQDFNNLEDSHNQLLATLLQIIPATKENRELRSALTPDLYGDPTNYANKLNALKNWSNTQIAAITGGGSYAGSYTGAGGMAGGTPYVPDYFTPDVTQPMYSSGM